MTGVPPMLLAPDGFAEWSLLHMSLANNWAILSWCVVLSLVIGFWNSYVFQSNFVFLILKLSRKNGQHSTNIGTSC